MTTIEQNGLVYAGTMEEVLDVVCGLIDERNAITSLSDDSTIDIRSPSQ